MFLFVFNIFHNEKRQSEHKGEGKKLLALRCLNLELRPNSGGTVVTGPSVNIVNICKTGQ